MRTVHETGEISRADPRFPPQLLPIVPEVKTLYYRGTWRNDLFSHCVAVVGSRKMSPYGKRVIDELAPRLISAGCPVVSGFMYGVDIEVHRKVLVGGGRAIAVLGHGIDYVDDIQNNDLYYKSLENDSLFIAEWKDCVPKPHTFLLRNRIVVGISDAVIIVEAGERSGSLHSAEWALRLGKKLFAVPGSIQSPVSAGTNALIADGRAETLTWDALSHYLAQSAPNNYSSAGPIHPSKHHLSESERTLITLLRAEGPLSTHEIAAHVPRPTGEIMTTLTTLEMTRVICLERGEWKVL